MGWGVGFAVVAAAAVSVQAAQAVRKDFSHEVTMQEGTGVIATLPNDVCSVIPKLDAHFDIVSASKFRVATKDPWFAGHIAGASGYNRRSDGVGITNGPGCYCKGMTSFAIHFSTPATAAALDVHYSTAVQWTVKFLDAAGVVKKTLTASQDGLFAQKGQDWKIAKITVDPSGSPDVCLDSVLFSVADDIAAPTTNPLPQVYPGFTTMKVARGSGTTTFTVAEHTTSLTAFLWGGGGGASADTGAGRCYEKRTWDDTDQATTDQLEAHTNNKAACEAAGAVFIPIIGHGGHGASCEVRLAVSQSDVVKIVVGAGGAAGQGGQSTSIYVNGVHKATAGGGGGGSPIRAGGDGGIEMNACSDWKATSGSRTDASCRTECTGKTAETSVCGDKTAECTCSSGSPANGNLEGAGGVTFCVGGVPTTASSTLPTLVPRAADVLYAGAAARGGGFARSTGSDGRAVWLHDAPTCGNCRTESGETCDDCNRVAGDGCSANCLVEAGYNCLDVSASEKYQMKGAYHDNACRPGAEAPAAMTWTTPGPQGGRVTLACNNAYCLTLERFVDGTARLVGSLYIKTVAQGGTITYHPGYNLDITFTGLRSNAQNWGTFLMDNTCYALGGGPVKMSALLGYTGLSGTLSGQGKAYRLTHEGTAKTTFGVGGSDYNTLLGMHVSAVLMDISFSPERKVADVVMSLDTQPQAVDTCGDADVVDDVTFCHGVETVSGIADDTACSAACCANSACNRWLWFQGECLHKTTNGANTGCVSDPSTLTRGAAVVRGSTVLSDPQVARSVCTECKQPLELDLCAHATEGTPDTLELTFTNPTGFSMMLHSITAVMMDTDTPTEVVFSAGLPHLLGRGLEKAFVGTFDELSPSTRKGAYTAKIVVRFRVTETGVELVRTWNLLVFVKGAFTMEIIRPTTTKALNVGTAQNPLPNALITVKVKVDGTTVELPSHSFYVTIGSTVTPPLVSYDSATGEHTLQVRPPPYTDGCNYLSEGATVNLGGGRCPLTVTVKRGGTCLDVASKTINNAVQWTVAGQELSLAIDESGSMGWSSGDREGRRHDAAKTIIDRLIPGSYLSIIYFTYSAQILQSAVQITESNKQTIKNKLYIKASGGTDVLAGLAACIAQLESKALAFPEAVIVLTDGVDSNQLSQYRAASAAAAEKGIKIHSVCLANACASGTANEKLVELPSSSGGLFRLARNPSELDAVYADLFDDLSGASVLTTLNFVINWGETKIIPVTVDSLASPVAIRVTISSGSISQVTLKLTLPNGDVIGESSEQGVVYYEEIAAKGYHLPDTAATYYLHIKGSDLTGNELGVTTRVSGSSDLTLSALIPTRVDQHSAVPILAYVTPVGSMSPLTGISIVATVTTADGSKYTFPLSDTGGVGMYSTTFLAEWGHGTYQLELVATGTIGCTNEAFTRILSRSISVTQVTNPPEFLTGEVTSPTFDTTINQHLSTPTALHEFVFEFSSSDNHNNKWTGIVSVTDPVGLTTGAVISPPPGESLWTLYPYNAQHGVWSTTPGTAVKASWVGVAKCKGLLRLGANVKPDIYNSHVTVTSGDLTRTVVFQIKVVSLTLDKTVVTVKEGQQFGFLTKLLEGPAGASGARLFWSDASPYVLENGNGQAHPAVPPITSLTFGSKNVAVAGLTLTATVNEDTNINAAGKSDFHIRLRPHLASLSYPIAVGEPHGYTHTIVVTILDNDICCKHVPPAQCESGGTAATPATGRVRDRHGVLISNTGAQGNNICCTGHGTFVESQSGTFGTCDCDEGFGGAACNCICDCKAGTCISGAAADCHLVEGVQTLYCNCPAGTYGPLCKSCEGVFPMPDECSTLCTTPCKNGGQPIIEGGVCKCRCPTNTCGTFCGTSCPGFPNDICAGKGTCTDCACTCTPPYYGAGCTLDCTTVCNGNAVNPKASPSGDECICGECKDFYEGDKCEGCSVHYVPTCDACASGSAAKRGPTGELLSCGPCTIGDPCSAHGTAANPAPTPGALEGCVCTCKVGYAGPECKTCDYSSGYICSSKSGDVCITCTRCPDCGPPPRETTDASTDDTCGDCVCPAGTGYTGPSCNTCPPKYNSNGCKTCAADHSGTFPNCVLCTVDNNCGGNAHSVDVAATCSCNCKTGYVGTSCQTCDKQAGYYVKSQTPNLVCGKCTIDEHCQAAGTLGVTVAPSGDACKCICKDDQLYDATQGCACRPIYNSQCNACAAATP
eukprot:Rhum_TRINITY_DN14354_c0_g1::Rhum_TRINITY_DN14354_c0_g1_i1::g.82702::m.82702